jgi:hypothetical protein
VLNGRDRFYVLASSRGGLSVPFPDSGWPLSLRVARHLAGVAALVGALGDVTADKAVVLAGVPDCQTVVTRGLGSLLRKP